MASYPHRLTIVVNATIAANVNTRALEVDPEAGQVFTIGLSPTGQLPITHYWCGWQVTEDQRSGLLQRLQQAVDNGNARVYNGDNRTPQEILTILGLKTVEGSI